MARFFGLFSEHFGHPHGTTGKRNSNYLLEDPRPIEDYGDDQYTGNEMRDGYKLLARADPDDQGHPPNVAGTIRACIPGQKGGFEQ